MVINNQKYFTRTCVLKTQCQLIFRGDLEQGKMYKTIFNLLIRHILMRMALYEITRLYGENILSGRLSVGHLASKRFNQMT